jgi:ketosteroid isomerase-like protein
MRQNVKYLIAVVIFLVCAMTPGNAIADDTEDIRAASDAAQVTIQQALVEENSGKLASVFTEDGAVITPDGRVVKGRQTIRATALLLLAAFGAGDLEIIRYDVSVIDNTGYETGKYVYKWTTGDDKVQTFVGRYVTIWKQEAKQWKVNRLIGIP